MGTTARYAPGAGAAEMVEAIVKEIVELDLNEKESADMAASAEAVREIMGAYNALQDAA